MKVLLITGGDSSEREVSLKSAANVEQALEENGHDVLLYDLSKGYEPIIKLAEQYDVLFPVLHGEEGEGGLLHEFLSKINKPIVGTRNYKGLQQAWYKIPFKKFCDENGIKTSPWEIVKNKKEIIKFGLPCVLKASNGGSSKEVIILKSEKDFNEEFEKLLNSKMPLFVEKYLTGTEVTVGILNGETLPLIEIVPPKGQWFSYENKYTSATAEIPFAPSVSSEIQELVKEIVIKFTEDLSLGSYLRVDFMIYENIPYALDVNTIPGLTSESLLPKAAKAAGMDFGQFLEVLLKSAN